ncbi:UNVERIFIED_CONTAM: hypothetical protein K2H54_021697 [Gekko kuhli]
MRIRKIGHQVKMPMTAMEVALQTMGLCLREYVVKEDDGNRLTRDGLCQLVKDLLQDFVLEGDDSCEKVYCLKVPLNTAIVDLADGTQVVNFMMSKIFEKNGKLGMDIKFPSAD